MKWKKLLHKQNARHFAWPAGWDTAEAIAEQLECSAERVRDHLAPSIRAGEVEMKQFTIWDGETGRKVIRTGFRIGGAKGPEKPSAKATKKSSSAKDRRDRWPFYEGAVIKRMDSPRLGVVRKGKIEWEDGRVFSEVSTSTRHKLRLVK